MISNITKIQFIRHVFVGGFASIVDWILFYLFALELNIYYQFSLILSFSIATTINYILSKILTFKCKSKKITRQFLLFLFFSIITLLLSMLLMFIMVDMIFLEKMISRILTTFILLLFNFFVSKKLIFNRRFFQ